MVHLGVEKHVTLLVGDLLAPFDTDELRGRVDLLTCNPPYISTGRMATMPDEIVGHEPALAFDGGPLGIRILQRLIREDRPACSDPEAGWPSRLASVRVPQSSGVCSAQEITARSSGCSMPQGRPARCWPNQ